MMTRNTSKNYYELIKLKTFDERLQYLLDTHGAIGEDTFGSMRYVNQRLYSSSEWKRVRRDVIVRDNGCDLAIPSLEIFGRIYVHHIVPITLEDFENNSSLLLSKSNLICISEDTHKILHYGSKERFDREYVERKENDTIPWR